MNSSDPCVPKCSTASALEDVLDVRVVRGEAVVGRRGLGEEQAHRVTLVAEGRLDADEDVAELGLPYTSRFWPSELRWPGRGAPVLVQVLLVQAELLVLLDGHLVDDVEVRATRTWPPCR